MLSFLARWLLPAAFAVPLATLAAVPDPATGPPLDLQTAIRRSLERNPGLAVAGFDLRAQEGWRTQAALRPNPELNIEIEDFSGSGVRNDFSVAQTTLSLRQVLERGAREVRVAAANAGLSQLEAELAEKRVDEAAETARRFYRVLSDQERLRLTHESSELAIQAVAAARTRVRAAQAPDAELARAEAMLARTLLDHEDVEHELLTGRYELASLWGSDDPGFGLAQGNLLAMPNAEPFETAAARIQRNPSVLKFASTKKLREAELRLAQQKRRAPWSVHAGIRRFEEGDDFAAVAGLSLPLAPHHAARGETMAAQAKLDQVDVERAATELSVRTQLFHWLQELGHSRHAAKVLDEDVIPRVAAALKQTQYAYERGRYSYSELVAAQRELLEVRRSRIQVALEAYGYATEIDRLTGQVSDLGPDAAAVGVSPHRDAP